MGPVIWVMGSAICDLVFSVDRFPARGETVLGRGFARFAGGKGANQAVSAARLGAAVQFVGKVGRDPFGDQLKCSLVEAGVGVEFLYESDIETGCASILLDSFGQNQIVVNPGANHDLTVDEVGFAFAKAQPGDYVLLQQEMLAECNLAAAVEGLQIILNPAPARPIPSELLSRVYAVTPNETEVEALTGIHVSTRESCRAAASDMLKMGASRVAITLGERGCYYFDGLDEFIERAPLVKAVDTVGAGDAFNGSLAVALSLDLDWHNALQFANKAAAISVTKRGAQDSMPTLAEIGLGVAP